MPRGVYQHKRRPLEDRFWEKVDKRGPTECWEWTGAKHNQGYGHIGKGGQEGIAFAHRVSWELHYGPIPEGQCVCHHCDNPGCVNPRHLFLGTHADNTKDMKEKGRAIYVHGEAQGASKLTKQDVREILCFLAAGYSQSEIAVAYGVCRSTINKIAAGKNWAWLERPAWVQEMEAVRC